MDRRTFLGGVAAAGSIGAVATGVADRESSAGNARASGLVKATSTGPHASSAATAVRAGRTLAPHGVTLGYLPGSAGMFATPATERVMRPNATGLRWVNRDKSLANQTGQSAIHSLFKVSNLVDLSIGILRRTDEVATGTLRSLDIVAHFAIDDAPYFAPFGAWHYEAAGVSTPLKSTQPLSFSARVPDYVALEVNYLLDSSAIASGITSAGMMYLPIGASASSAAGLATGLYVFAAPSAYTGVQPDLSVYVFSGDVHAPVADPSGRALDFDYLTLAIRPVAI